ncbi:MAG: hypothetical protein IT247_06175 [Bacteroidia bacterium]|nr:hypothetical protein [Bacteroidia bacterium]
MKIAILCNSRLAIEAIKYLANTGELLVCGIPDRAHEENEEIAHLCAGLNIPVRCISRDGLQTDMTVMIKEFNLDAVLVFTFPYIIPEKLLRLPAYGFINFHFGILPAYRGADAIFWQIKNRETMGGISIHQMTARLDEGPLYGIQQVPIFPDDTYGSHSNSLALASAHTVSQLPLLLKQNHQPVPQNEKQANYYKKPQLADVMIDWTKPADEIIALINACNPWNKGAICTINGFPVKIIKAHKEANTTLLQPGEITAAANEKELHVACGANELLAIDIAYFANEFAHAQRLLKLGLGNGLRFDLLTQKIVA